MPAKPKRPPRDVNQTAHRIFEDEWLLEEDRNHGHAISLHMWSMGDIVELIESRECEAAVPIPAVTPY